MCFHVYLIRNLFVLLLSIFISVSVKAQSYILVKKSSEISSADQEIKPHLKFDLQQISYLSPSPVDSTSQQKAEAQFGLKKQGQIFFDTYVVVGGFSESQSSYFAIPEMYFGFGQDPKNTISFGRQVQSLSFLDQSYNFGLYNSYFSNDRIKYTAQGLTGVKAQYSNSVGGFIAGWQPLFFPNQGPQVREDKGAIVTSNRWAQRPPPQFQFADQNKRIEYAIRDYNINEIIRNQGQTLSLYLGESIQRPLFQVSYANHPLNEIPLSRDTYGSVLDFVGHAELSPIVTYHEVQSADLNFDFLNFQTTFSYIQDQPHNKTAPENETLQFLSPLQIYGIFLQADFTSVFNRQMKVSLAYADINGGEIKDLLQNGKESIFTFSSQRTQYRRPISMGFTTEFFIFKSKALHSEVKWIYDQAYKGSLLSTFLSYPVLDQMNLDLGFDLIGVQNQIAPDTPENYLSQNQANDRVYGGLQYVF